MTIEKEELYKITGGGISFGWSMFIGGAISLIIGIIDGYIRPLKCN
ncbi:MAG: hypothetical protein ACK5HP_02705 [Bacilli bacterium]